MSLPLPVVLLALVATILVAALLLWREQQRRWRWQRRFERLIAVVAGGGRTETLSLMQELQAEGAAAQATQLGAAWSSLQERLVLQESRRQELEDLLASAPDGLMLVDSEGRLRFLNPAAIQMFDLRIDAVLGAPLVQALPSFGLEAAIREALQQGRPVTRELQVFEPRRRELLLRALPVRRADGHINGALAALQDLTAMRHLERVRRDFVANASHELRTPVANIRAALETILTAPGDVELAQKFLPAAMQEAQRLSRLINDLLDLARLEQEASVEGERVNLEDAVMSTIAALAGKAQESGIAVQRVVEAGLTVSGNRGELEQVLINLLDNALSYTPAGGQVTVGARRLVADDETVEVWVKDTGIGIAAEDRERIFERFQRVDKARSRAAGGTGLGLAIARHIVENHGGRITLESETGQGSTFRVLLPAPAA